MRNYRRARRWLQRALSSGLVLGLALALLAGLGVVAVSLVRAREHQQAVTSAVADAHVIAGLTAVRDLGSENETQPLTARERADLDGDVAQLTAGGDLLELSIVRSDGAPLYRAGLLGTGVGLLAVAAPMRSAVVHFFNATGPTLRGTQAITVVLPETISLVEPPLLVGVTIPARSVQGPPQAASGLFSLATIVAVLVTAAGLIMMRRRLRRRLYEASHDSLTSLGNRALLERAADSLFEGEEPFALLTMDLDGFRRVNDSLGHAAGDELLVLVAGALRGNVRPQDLLVRLGGDEFAVLMRGLPAPDVATAADRLLIAVRRQFTTRGVAVDCDASVGVALARLHGGDFGQLLQAADIAMNHAKLGKLGVPVFAESGDDVGADDLQTLMDLREAFDSGQLVLHYQPAVAIGPAVENDGGSYLEALVRWRHPTRGLVPPDRFIPLAEDTALIHPLSRWVLNEAMRQCAAWRRDGLETTIAVNISPRSLTHPGLVSTVIDTLARYQLPAAAIHLEITESAVISRPELARDILTQLRDQGVCISMDDFGAGYTSLAHLKTLPVRTLKVDRGFVSDLLTEHSDETIVASVITLAHGLGMQVVAEGVEDEATLQHLAVLGCDFAQGFHLSRPLTAEAATFWLRQQQAPLRVTLDSGPLAVAAVGAVPAAKAVGQ